MPHRRIAAVAAALVLAGLNGGASGATRAGTVRIRTLKAPAPAWWTPELRREVYAAGSRGVPLSPEIRATIPTSSVTFLGIRPGQLILVDNGDATSLCTSNFVFSTGATLPSVLGPSAPAMSSPASTSPTSSRSSRAKPAAKPSPGFFIGTAGHCGRVGDQVTMLFLPLGLVHIGAIVKSTGSPQSVSATDFALISIDPALNQYVSPSMAYVGGPTGVFTGNGVQPLLHAGWGLVIGTGGTPRAAVAYRWYAGSEYRFEGAVVFGDSGSGAIVAGGLAAGNITHIAVDSREVPPAWNGGSTMVAILKYLGSSYTLATCALATPWPLPGCPPSV